MMATPRYSYFIKHNRLSGSLHVKQQINFKYYIDVKYAPLKEKTQFQVKDA